MCRKCTGTRDTRDERLDPSGWRYIDMSLNAHARGGMRVREALFRAASRRISRQVL